MKTIVQQLREKNGLTQSQLAQKTGLSLRTIQRVEAGSTPKGYTLTALAEAFEIAPQQFIPSKEVPKLNRAKLINFSSLIGVIVPFGGVFLPLFLTYKTSDEKNKELGKNIVSVQIVISVALAVTLILSTFIQKWLSLSFPIFIFPLLAIICLKLLVAFLNGVALNAKNDLNKALKFNYL